MKPQFRTERLYLRRLCRQDVPILAHWRNDEDCRRYQCWRQTSPSALRRFALRYRRSRLLSRQREQHYAVCLHDGTLVGDITVFYIRGDNVSIGYTIFPPFQRNGYAYELLSSLLPLLRAHYHLDICAIADRRNIASISLLYKLGFEILEKKSEENVFILSPNVKGETRDDNA